MSARAHFSQQLNEIAGVVGVEAAMRLADAHGGTRIYIPARAPDGHWLPDLLGRAAADAICAHFAVRSGGSYLDLPLGPKALYARARLRALELRAANGTGMSVERIASEVGVGRRVVHKWFAGLRDERQGDLFRQS